MAFQIIFAKIILTLINSACPSKLVAFPTTHPDLLNQMIPKLKSQLSQNEHITLFQTPPRLANSMISAIPPSAVPATLVLATPFENTFWPPFCLLPHLSLRQI